MAIQVCEKRGKMIIRCMMLNDYEKVYRLWVETPGVGLRSRDDAEPGIRKFLKRNPDTCFVAEEGDLIIGAILGGHDGRRGCIYHAAVSPGCRRQGIGRALVLAVIDAMRREQISKISLVAFADNRDGNAFWQSIGFNLRNDLLVRDLDIADN